MFRGTVASAYNRFKCWWRKFATHECCNLLCSPGEVPLNILVEKQEDILLRVISPALRVLKPRAVSFRYTLLCILSRSLILFLPKETSPYARLENWLSSLIVNTSSVNQEFKRKIKLSRRKLKGVPNVNFDLDTSKAMRGSCVLSTGGLDGHPVTPYPGPYSIHGATYIREMRAVRVKVRCAAGCNHDLIGHVLQQSCPGLRISCDNDISILQCLRPVGVGAFAAFEAIRSNSAPSLATLSGCRVEFIVNNLRSTTWLRTAVVMCLIPNSFCSFLIAAALGWP